jgi:sterol desaturase/sphingolipid hydroxylase (fatty acid hydroxylase superfamily)
VRWSASDKFATWSLIVAGILNKIKSELETPRDLRSFGSGWLSGSGALLCGLVSVAFAIALKFPGTLTTPELAKVLATGWFKLFQHLVLLLGYVFALTSLLLRKDKTLGFVSMALVMAAALMGGSQAEAIATRNTSIYFGLDFFVINVLFAGLLFVPLERLFPKRKEQIVFRPDWQEDMFYFLVSSLFVQILAFLTLAPAEIVTSTADMRQVQTYIGSQPFLIQLILIMLFTDFVQYWVHRLFHRIPFLWRFHAVHHSAQTMDWFAGARMHFIEIIALRSLTAIPMFAMGFDLMAIQTYILIVYIYSAFIHANIGWDLGLIERFLATPRFHHWHHGIEKEAIDVNFAIHFPLYDWLFGTHHMPDKRWPEGYGVGGHPVPTGYWKQFMYPFRKTEAERAAEAAAKPNSGT